MAESHALRAKADPSGPLTYRARGIITKHLKRAFQISEYLGKCKYVAMFVGNGDELKAHKPLRLKELLSPHREKVHTIVGAGDIAAESYLE
jgi:hypothetical protein